MAWRLSRTVFVSGWPGGSPPPPSAAPARGSHVKPSEFPARVDAASAQSATLRAATVVDRTRFAMTWSPLGMASAIARATVVARFVRPE